MPLFTARRVRNQRLQVRERLQSHLQRSYDKNHVKQLVDDVVVKLYGHGAKPEDDANKLHDACRKSDLLTMRQLIQNGVSVNAPNPSFGETPLVSCVVASFVEGVELLIDLKERSVLHPEQRPVDVNKRSNVFTTSGDNLGTNSECKDSTPLDMANKVVAAQGSNKQRKAQAEQVRRLLRRAGAIESSRQRPRSAVNYAGFDETPIPRVERAVECEPKRALPTARRAVEQTSYSSCETQPKRRKATPNDPSCEASEVGKLRMHASVALQQDERLEDRQADSRCDASKGSATAVGSVVTGGSHTTSPEAPEAPHIADNRDQAVCARAIKGSNDGVRSHASTAGAVRGPTAKVRRRIDSDDEDAEQRTDGTDSAHTIPAASVGHGVARSDAHAAEAQGVAPCVVDLTVEEDGRPRAHAQARKPVIKNNGPSRPSSSGTSHTDPAQVQKELRQACSDRDLSAMLRLIAKGASVNAPDPNFGETPLNTCVKESFIDGIRLLIDVDRRRKLHPGQQPVDVNQPSDVRTKAGDSLGMDAENRNIRPIELAYKVCSAKAHGDDTSAEAQKSVLNLLRSAGASEVRRSRSAFIANHTERTDESHSDGDGDSNGDSNGDSDGDGDGDSDGPCGSNRLAATRDYVSSALRVGRELNIGSGHGGKMSSFYGGSSDESGSETEGKARIVDDDADDPFAKRVLSKLQWAEEKDGARHVRRRTESPYAPPAVKVRGSSTAMHTTATGSSTVKPKVVHNKENHRSSMQPWASAASVVARSVELFFWDDNEWKAYDVELTKTLARSMPLAEGGLLKDGVRTFKLGVSRYQIQWRELVQTNLDSNVSRSIKVVERGTTYGASHAWAAANPVCTNCKRQPRQIKISTSQSNPKRNYFTCTCVPAEEVWKRGVAKWVDLVAPPANVRCWNDARSLQTASAPKPNVAGMGPNRTTSANLPVRSIISQPISRQRPPASSSASSSAQRVCFSCACPNAQQPCACIPRHSMAR